MLISQREQKRHKVLALISHVVGCRGCAERVQYKGFVDSLPELIHSEIEKSEGTCAIKSPGNPRIAEGTNTGRGEWDWEKEKDHQQPNGKGEGRGGG